MSDEAQTTLRLPRLLLERAESLARHPAPGTDIGALGSGATRAHVLRIALNRGLNQLEAERRMRMRLGGGKNRAYFVHPVADAVFEVRVNQGRGMGIWGEVFQDPASGRWLIAFRPETTGRPPNSDQATYDDHETAARALYDAVSRAPSPRPLARMEGSFFPRPASPAHFEALVRDVLQRAWNAPRLVPVADKGTGGYDLGGPAGLFGDRQVAVKCHFGDRLATEDVRAAVERSDAVNDHLAAFVIATTSSDSEQLREDVRRLNADRIHHQRCGVDVISWESLCGALLQHPDLVMAHYPTPPPAKRRPTRKPQDSSSAALVALGAAALGAFLVSRSDD